jgi:hypothetical protein
VIAPDTTRFVVVALVAVKPVMFATDAVSEPKMPLVIFASDAKRFVDDAVPATDTLPANVDVAVVEVAWKLELTLVLLAVEGTTIQVGSVGGQLGSSVCPG